MFVESSPRFVGLHRHSHYSKRDAIAKIPDIVNRVGELNQSAWALTDHGTTSGLMEAYKETQTYNKKNGTNIKFIFGCEMYWIPNVYIKERQLSCHLLVLAKNEVGYKNLLRLVTVGYGDKGKTDNFFYTMRVTNEDIAKYQEGLIFTSACMGGILNPHTDGIWDEKLAYERARTFRDMCEFYLEIQCATPWEQVEYNQRIVKMGEDLDIPVIVTEDSHYVNKDEADTHRKWLGLDENSSYYTTDDYYIHSESKVRDSIDYLPNRDKYIANTQKIANSCEQVEISFGGKHFPSVDVTDPAQAVRDIMKEKGKLKTVPQNKLPVYLKQIEHEMKVLERCDYLTYFLMTEDFLRAGRERGVRFGVGRGSVGGSLVAYLMDITRIDPIKYGLIFERFANEHRVTLPDIDIDLPNTRREEMIQYLVDKYKEVYHVRTFGTMGEKAAIQRAARSLGYSPEQVRKLSKDISSISEIEDKELKNLSEKYVGVIQHFGCHASAIMLFPDAAENYCAIEKQGEDYVCAYEYTDLEKMGLLKEDVLGIKTLDAIDECVRRVGRIDLDNLPDTNKKTFDMLKKGDVLGCFQIESKGMRELLKTMKPDTVFDLVPLVALYRPSTIQSGMVDEFTKRRDGEPFEYLHPKLEEVLKETYGVLLYQEQAMKIVQVMAGYDLGQADIFRRAIGKKHPEEMAVLIPKFVKDGMDLGIDKDIMEKLAEWLTNCASYQFNKSHSAAYGVICYQTAWLKANHPAEYYCAYLNAYHNDKQSDLLPYIKDARKHCKILPPDGRVTSPGWRIENGNIRMAINYIKGVGDVPLPITMDNVHSINKGKLENLIKAGALDYLGDREDMLQHLYNSKDIEKLNRQLKRATEYRDKNQKILETAKESTKKYTDAKAKVEKYANQVWDIRQKLEDIKKLSFDQKQGEIEVLGMTFDDPFKGYDISKYSEPKDNEYRIVLCIVKSTRPWKQKNGKPMMFFTIECPSGNSYDMVMFNSCLTPIEKNKTYVMSTKGNKFQKLLR